MASIDGTNTNILKFCYQVQKGMRYCEHSPTDAILRRMIKTTTKMPTRAISKYSIPSPPTWPGLSRLHLPPPPYFQNAMMCHKQQTKLQLRSLCALIYPMEIVATLAHCTNCSNSSTSPMLWKDLWHRQLSRLLQIWLAHAMNALKVYTPTTRLQSDHNNSFSYKWSGRRCKRLRRWRRDMKREEAQVLGSRRLEPGRRLGKGWGVSAVEEAVNLQSGSHGKTFICSLFRFSCNKVLRP